MKGRKPKPDAQRRGGITPEILRAAAAMEAEIIEAPRVEKPLHVAMSPIQSQCWDSLVSTSPCFEACDIPLMEAYCFWYEVLRQAESDILAPNGGAAISYEEPTNSGSKRVQNPDIRTAEKATAMLRLIGGELNLTPNARDRAGLMRAMTKSTQADIVKKTLDGYEQFKKQQKALNAAK